MRYKHYTTESVEKLEQKQEMIVQTFSKESTKEFRPWVKSCITAIVENLNYFEKVLDFLSLQYYI